MTTGKTKDEHRYEEVTLECASQATGIKKIIKIKLQQGKGTN